MKYLARFLPLMFLVGVAACSSSERQAYTPPPTNDAGPTDGGVADAGGVDAGQPDAGCATPCGTTCCTGEEVCNQFTQQCEAPCTPQCGTRECGSDGCHGDCGHCPGAKSCSPDGMCQCLPSGGACISSADCCTGTCTNGMCSGSSCATVQQSCARTNCCPGAMCSPYDETCCLLQGAGCNTNGDCCTGTCTNGQCACAAAGVRCASDVDCCDGTCEGGKCQSATSCNPVGQACGAGCCSGLSCAPSTSTCCAPQNHSCSGSNECCSGLACTNGFCQPASACSPVGQACGAGCCSGLTCTNGTCQQPVSSPGWKVVTSPVATIFFGIATVDSAHTWIAGGVNGSGSLLQWSSATSSFSDVTPSGTPILYDAAGIATPGGGVAVWAVGDSGRVLKGPGTWTAGTLGNAALFGIGLVSASDVWAVGNDTSSGAFHFDGSSWSARSMGFSTTAQLLGANAFATNSVWAVGVDGTGASVQTWNGATWAPVTSVLLGQSNEAMAVGGTSPSDIWVVGQDPAFLSASNSEIGHWNGTKWETPVTNSESLNSVWAGSKTDVWVVGLNGYIAHWNGSQWQQEGSGLTTSNLWCVRGNATEVWAAGENGVILHRSR